MTFEKKSAKFFPCNIRPKNYTLEMTIKQLIEKLQTFPGHMEVTVGNGTDVDYDFEVMQSDKDVIEILTDL